MNRKATFKFRGKTYAVTQNKNVKKVDGPDYHLKMDLKSGYTERWGTTKEEDPVMAPWPEIADVEAGTICHGAPDEKGILKPCKHCYKSNTGIGSEMSVETAEKVLESLSIGTYEIIDENNQIHTFNKYDKAILHSGEEKYIYQLVPGNIVIRIKE